MAARLVAWVGFAWSAASEEEALVTIQAVVFDIGETLLDDSREFGACLIGSACPAIPSPPSWER
jgi:hypothetical protein